MPLKENNTRKKDSRQIVPHLNINNFLKENEILPSILPILVKAYKSKEFVKEIVNDLPKNCCNIL